MMSAMIKTKPITIRFPIELYDTLENNCKRSYRSFNKQVVAICQKHVDTQKVEFEEEKVDYNHEYPPIKKGFEKCSLLKTNELYVSDQASQ